MYVLLLVEIGIAGKYLAGMVLIKNCWLNSLPGLYRECSDYFDNTKMKQFLL
jgi:hypothetical protein